MEMTDDQRNMPLVDVVQKGFQTYNEWGIVIKRWYEIPHPDSL